MSRAEQLAEALILVARSNHYMVGIVEPVTQDEIDSARQILITKQNALSHAYLGDSDQQALDYGILDLAIDFTERPLVHSLPLKEKE
jgi:hypothetical protein